MTSQWKPTNTTRLTSKRLFASQKNGLGDLTRLTLTYDLDFQFRQASYGHDRFHYLHRDADKVSFLQSLLARFSPLTDALCQPGNEQSRL